MSVPPKGEKKKGGLNKPRRRRGKKKSKTQIVNH